MNFNYKYILFSSVITLIFLGLYLSDTFSWFDLKVFDFTMNYLDSGLTDSNIVVIEYDDATAEHNTSLITRNDIITLINKLDTFSPKVIAIDNFSVFGENIGSSISINQDNHNNISLGIGLSVPSSEHGSDTLKSFEEINTYCYPASLIQDIDLYSANRVFKGTITDNKSGQSAGHLVLIPDADGIFRRMPAMIRCGGGFLFSFGIQAALDYLGVNKTDIQFNKDISGIKNLKINQNGLMLVRFQGYDRSIKTISMIDLFNGSALELDFKKYVSIFRNKLVFIGNSSIRTARFLSTPINHYIPSIQLHAIVASNILSGECLYDCGKSAAVIGILLTGLVLSFLISFLKSHKAAFFSGVIIPFSSFCCIVSIQLGANVPIFSITFYASTLYLFLMIFRYLEYKNLLLAKLHQLQNELRMKERLVTIGEMSSKVAHEIRNPLNAIQLHLSLLKRKQASGKTEEFIDVIHEESQRLNRYITSLLQFGKPIVLTFQTTNIVDVINSTVTLLDPELSNKFISIHINHDTSDQYVSADADQLREVFINLIKNSIESIVDGGVIHICTYCKKTDFVIELSDNGKGIPPDVLERLFTPFLTTKKHGTGLGLAIVKKIIEAHHGTIKIKSAENKGTNVILHIPIAK